MRSQTLALAGAALIALLALTGCDPTGGPSGSPTPPATPSATATPSASPSPTPTAGGGDGAGGTPATQDCDTILTPAEREFITTSGLALTPPAEFFAKIRSEIPPGFVSPWLFFQDNGGIVCTWHDGYEVIWAYGVMDLPMDQYPAFRDAMLNSDPYLMEESDAVLFSTQMGSNPFAYVLVSGSGRVYLGTTLELLEAVRTAVG